MCADKFIYSLTLVTTVLLLEGCSSTLPTQSDGEILSSLSKVTDGENKCSYPFGGDNGKNLFFSVKDKSSNYCNIFAKADPFSASMSQKTGGKNYHIAPSYSASTQNKHQ